MNKFRNAFWARQLLSNMFSLMRQLIWCFVYLNFQNGCEGLVYLRIKFEMILECRQLRIEGVSSKHPLRYLKLKNKMWFGNKFRSHLMVKDMNVLVDSFLLLWNYYWKTKVKQGLEMVLLLVSSSILCVEFWFNSLLAS